ncbi:GNAT family N-acetyltransferase [Leifsonia poae]|uniref:GNAT family N-acetyltransferase n=1 Tax=Leifsonia poae TaxID=110933 RepID=UPI001CBE1639|nr:N-acetyltransferase [Leifsonia poae]
MTPTSTTRTRTAEAGDAALLRALFAETRGAELAAAGLDRAALDQLVEIQHRSHTAQVAASHPGATATVIEIDGEAAGMLLVDRSSEAMHIVDFTVAAAHRGRGAGTAALADLTTEADAAHRAITLEVWALNSGAIGLYERAGFAVIGERSGSLELRREPNG